MSKDAYWFKHDSNASRDIKLMKLKHIYDFWGLGLYWSVIELLREQPDYQFNSDENSLQLACSLVSCSDFNRFKSWFFDAVKFELFIIQENMFFSESLCKRMGKWETKKTNGSKGGRPPKTESKTELKPKSKAKRNHKIIKDKIIKDNIPELNEFLEYCKTIKEFNFPEYEYSLESKFNTWKEDGWKDGNGNYIKNWKSKIRNTYPHLKPIRKPNAGASVANMLMGN